ncbi:hypothetical protein [Mesorhizobium sp. Z1-4]|uniref:hypothetical protein n=1 Tax=Mesorhizobium sp. Z1-4 TaxID=2448478 RepID=UPI000FDC9B92|nr:hypothetical protein [Mesorhizobium sp. Z1-4]
MFADGACVYETDDKGNIIMTQAWARNEIVARVAFNELRAANPTKNYIAKRRAWVLAEHKAASPKPTETMTIRVSPELASAVRGYAIARDTNAASLAAEIIETHLAGLGLIDGELTNPALSRFTPTKGEA